MECLEEQEQYGFQQEEKESEPCYGDCEASIGALSLRSHKVLKGI